MLFLPRIDSEKGLKQLVDERQARVEDATRGYHWDRMDLERDYATEMERIYERYVDDAKDDGLEHLLT